jgi:aspartyl-tRNA synthetase
MNFTQRTVSCGELRPGDAGKSVVLNGWVDTLRDHGGVIFINLRDRYGITQIVISPDEQAALAVKARGLGVEYVLWAAGAVRMRENPNPKIPTGLVEVVASEFEIISAADLPPFEIMDEQLAGEELRLRYRYLDLRRPGLQRNFLIRNRLYQVIHRYFDEHNFVEFETPVLTKSTPEGARDYLVPSRIHKGNFYALPQSPQIYKQLLMVSGFDRYMQIVKCFRDEDLRADRQPEFTQIDVEMSFVRQDDVLAVAEGFVVRAWKEILGYDVQLPLKRITFREAMSRYGSDKPDLRYNLELHEITNLVRNSGFAVFATATAQKNGTIAGINAKSCANFSRKQLDELTEHAKKYGAKGLSWMKLADGGVQSPIAKFLTEEEIAGIVAEFAAQEGDLLLFAADEWERCCTIMGAVRTEVARRSGILEAVKHQFSFHWVTEFPLLEYSEEDCRYVARHHPFTAPMEEDLELLTSDPAQARAITHDLVINGYEVAGGSIRIHRNDVQQRMFDLLGMSREEADAKFGFLLKALRFGVPPHGGIAFGLDRLCMLLCGTDNIRDVIVFPKTTSAFSLMDGSPSDVSAAQLRELGITLATKQD